MFRTFADAMAEETGNLLPSFEGDDVESELDADALAAMEAFAPTVAVGSSVPKRGRPSLPEEEKKARSEARKAAKKQEKKAAKLQRAADEAQ